MNRGQRNFLSSVLAIFLFCFLFFISSDKYTAILCIFFMGVIQIIDIYMYEKKIIPSIYTKGFIEGSEQCLKNLRKNLKKRKTTRL